MQKNVVGIIPEKIKVLNNSQWNCIGCGMIQKLLTTPRVYDTITEWIIFATIAQQVEHVTCNDEVPGSIPGGGSRNIL